MAHKRTVPPHHGIDIGIDLGTRKPTEEQIKQLKKSVSNQVLSWVKNDLREDPAPPITCTEGPWGGQGDENQDDDTGG